MIRTTAIGRPKAFLATAAAVIALSGAAGCGDDDGSSEAPASAPAPAQSTTGDQAVTGNQGATGPASAGDQRPAAPDDKISDRPGGPNSKGSSGGKKQKKSPSVSGGLSTTPSSP